MDFEDDPHAPEARGINKGGQGAAPAKPARSADEAAQEQSGEPVDHDKAIQAILAEDSPLKDLRAQAHNLMGAIGATPARMHATLREHSTEAKLRDVVHRLNLMVDEDAAGQTTLDTGGGS